ncbi:MAG: MGH1-like glycoside hydrolase domain-containing protein, partial [Candidatus Hydrogenedens sp.]
MGLEKSRVMEMIKNNELWQEWGPYLPERQWGTVRECWAPPEKAWEYTTFETAKKYNYLCGDDGIFGWSDRSGKLCFALSFWNGSDPCLKERFFGLNALEGNHAEDVKEYYYYLDAVPSYAYAKA